MKNKTKVREPLFHIVKRDTLPLYESWGIRIGAVIIALIITAVITMLLTGENPAQVYKTMIDGTFRSERTFWMMLQELVMLLGVSLAVTPAFKMRFWNIGGEGQVLAGALAATACMKVLRNYIDSNAGIIICMIVTGIIAGALWAVIPAIFKAFFNTNETLFTLMMNYVAIQIVSFFVMFWEYPKGAGQIGLINDMAGPNYHKGWFPVLGNNEYLLNVLVIAVMTVFMYVYLKYSKHGYEIAVVGESENTARYIGINVKKVIIRTLILSGALCGIVGVLLVGSTNHTLAVNIAGGRGFTAIMVSWLAKFNPIYMVLTAFLLAFFGSAAGEIQTVFKVDHAFSDIITGIILFFIIGSEFFINYKIVFRSKHKEVA